MRKVTFLIAAGVAATGLVACEPPPVLPTFTVTTTADGVDADPGDGVCEVTDGAGDCSLRAAVQEANAGEGATVMIPDGEHLLTVADGDGDGDIDVHTAVTLIGTGTTPFQAEITTYGGGPVTAEVIEVHPGAHLRTEAVYVTSVRVGGRFDAVRTAIGPTDSLRIDAGASAVLINSQVSSVAGTAIRNAGDLTVLYSTLRGIVATALLDTQGAGVTRIGASLLLHAQNLGVGNYPVVGSRTHCTGSPVVSLGRNYSASADCGFTAPGDVPPATPVWPTGVLSAIPAGAPSVDAIPEGTLGCGDTAVDAMNGARPVDGNADSVVACDIGADERQG